MLYCGILIACYAQIKFHDATPTPYAQYAICTRYYPVQMRSLSWFRLDILFIQNKFSLLLVSTSKSVAFSQQSYYLLLLFFPLEVLFGNENTTGDGFFAECPILCRVLFIGRSAKRLFAECQGESTRQTTGTRQRGGLPSNNTRQRPGLLSVGHSANQNTRQRDAVVNPLPSVFF